MLQYSDDFTYKLERYPHNIQSRHVVSWIPGWIHMHLSNKATDTPVYRCSRDGTFHRHLHHALLAIFPDNNFTGILHHEMHAIFPGKHDDYTKSTKDRVVSQ